jgi:hypothetical protein
MNAGQRVVWIEMLFAANWKDDEFWYGTKRIIVKRGQFAHSEDELARRAKVGRQVVRSTFALLVTAKAITRETSPLGNRSPTITTIVNYERYQGTDDNSNQQNNQAPTKPQPKPNQAPTLREEVEEYKEGKETTLARNPADAGFARGGKVDSEISVGSGQLDLPAARPAEAEGEERRSPASSPPPKLKRKDADSPSGRLFAYWRDELWPQVGEGTYLASKADFTQLAAALRDLSEAEVRKVLKRAVADPFWAGKPLKAICSTSALNSLRAHPNGTQPSTPRTGCQPWDELLAQAATNGGRETVKCLREYVSPRLEDRTLVLEVPDRYRADYVERHLPEIESAALEWFGLTVQLLVTPPAQEAVCLP